jgi:ornithine cyclodeaminase/alanine dehydrogenase-like protein (mu-crystallin family)
MRTIFIREAEVAELVTIQDALDVMSECFSLWPEVRAQNVARQRIKMPKGMFNLLGAGYSPRDVFGVKAYFASPAGAKFNILLHSADSGDLLAVIEADLLSRLRTGAASGLATRLLAREDAKVLGVIGSGQQALTQVAAISNVRALERVLVFSRTAAHARTFAARVERELGLRAEATTSAQECVTSADVVTTITKSAEPVCCGEWLRPGVHINAAGANAAARRELDDGAVLNASVRCTDSLAQARDEAGEFLALARENRLDWSGIVELGDIASGAAPGRSGPDDITLFKSLGIGIEDVAFAELIYRRAIAAGGGR